MHMITSNVLFLFISDAIKTFRCCEWLRWNEMKWGEKRKKNGINKWINIVSEKLKKCWTGKLFLLMEIKRMTYRKRNNNIEKYFIILARKMRPIIVKRDRNEKPSHICQPTENGKISSHFGVIHFFVCVRCLLSLSHLCIRKQFIYNFPVESFSMGQCNKQNAMQTKKKSEQTQEKKIRRRRNKEKKSARKRK